MDGISKENCDRMKVNNMFKKENVVRPLHAFIGGKLGWTLY